MNLFLLKILFIGVNHFDFTFMMVIRGSDANPGMVDCIIQAAQYVGQRKVAVEFAEENKDLVSEILKKLKLPVVLNSVEHRKPEGIESRTSNDVLLLLKDVDAEKILNETLWHGETRFLIITKNKNKIEKYFEHFWKLKVINIFGMVLTEGDDFLYSFLPYRKHNCKELEFITVDTCHKGQLLAGGVALKDQSRIKTMNGCPVTLTVTDARPGVIFEPESGHKNTSRIKGFEGNFMAEVAKIYNFKPTFKLADDGIGWGWIHPYPQGAIGDLYLGVTDISVGMLGPIQERYDNLDISKSYNLDECVTFAVPRGYGAKKSAWLTIFVLEFTSSTWILILFSFILTSINMWLINNYLSINWFRDKMDLTLALISSCLGMPNKTPEYASAKTSVTFWIVFCFIVTVAYKASMGSKLTVPPRDVDIHTFEELLRSDLKLIGFKNMRQVLVNADNWEYKMMAKRYHITNDSIEKVVERLAGGEKIAYLRHTSTFYYFSLLNPKSRGRIYMIDECVFKYHPSVMMKKFSPFTNRISQIVSRLEESGIMEMWRAEHVKKVPPPTKPFFKLSINQMYGIFYFLCIGYVIALFSFLCELVFIFDVYKFSWSLFRLLSLRCVHFNKRVKQKKVHKIRVSTT